MLYDVTEVAAGLGYGRVVAHPCDTESNAVSVARLRRALDALDEVGVEHVRVVVGPREGCGHGPENDGFVALRTGDGMRDAVVAPLDADAVRGAIGDGAAAQEGE